MSAQALEVRPTPTPRVVLGLDGVRMEVPAGWALLPPGDAGLTRRVKAAGPSWQVIEPRGRKMQAERAAGEARVDGRARLCRPGTRRFSRGLWAPEEHIEQARAALQIERSDPKYGRALEASRARRAEAEAAYALQFANAVIAFLRFSPAWYALAKRLAVAVAEHATPVGSGTVARTERIPIERRAEAAVIAWLRHQTTAYDDLPVPRVKGARRELRRLLAERSRTVLARHQHDQPHPAADCALCRVLAPRPA